MTFDIHTTFDIFTVNNWLDTETIQSIKGINIVRKTKPFLLKSESNYQIEITKIPTCKVKHLVHQNYIIW